MRRSTSLVLALAAFLACAANAFAQNQQYCRYPDTDSDRGWPIQKTSADGFLSEPGFNYEIVNRFVSDHPYAINIKKHDRFVISKGADGRLRLVHLVKSATKGYKTLAEAVLAVDSSGLWARGPAVHKTLGEVGEYVIFKLPDRGVEPNGEVTCRHSEHNRDNSTTRGVCKALHIEYFDDLDRDNLTRKPKMGQNVKVRLNESCRTPNTARMVETDDGDGDHGPD